MWKLTKKAVSSSIGMLPGMSSGNTTNAQQEVRQTGGGRRRVQQGPEEEAEEEMGEFGGGRAEGLGADGSLRTFRGHEGPIYGCSFAPGAQRFVSGGRDKTLRVWTLPDLNPEDGQEEAEDETPVVRTIKHHPGIVLACDFSPTGNEVASSSDDGNVYVFEAKSTRQRAVLTGHSSKVYGIVFTPVGSTCPGEYMASCSLDKTVRLWSTETSKEGGILRGHSDNVFGINFSNNGKLLATGGDDKNILLWDWRIGKKAHTLSGHQTTIWSVSWSPDDLSCVSTSMGHEIVLWDVRMEKPRWCIKDGHNKCPIHQAIFSGEGESIISGGRDKKVAVWDVNSGNRKFQLEGHTGTVYRLALHPAGDRLLTSSVDTTMKLWSFPPKGPVEVETVSEKVIHH